MLLELITFCGRSMIVLALLVAAVDCRGKSYGDFSARHPRRLAEEDILAEIPTSNSRKDAPADNDFQYDLNAAPWLLNNATILPYHGKHQLKDLLSSQNKHRKISVTLCTKPLEHFLLNWVFTLVTFGNIRNFIVATVDESSLASCHQLNLPCWDASYLAKDLQHSEALKYEQVHTLKLTRGSVRQRIAQLKPVIIQTVLQHGYDVHFSDIDVVFVRDVWANFGPILDMLGSDASCMREEFSDVNLINTGHCIFRYTTRTVNLLNAWANDTPQKLDFLDDQDWLNSKHLWGKFWDGCKSTAECAEIQKHDRAAVYTYPEQVTPGFGGQCPNHDTLDFCAPHVVAIHYICIHGKEKKMEYMKRHNLWFVGNTVMETPTLWFTRNQHHGLLPCKYKTAKALWLQDKEDF